MLCDACIGVLQYRRNCLIRKTEFLDLDPNGLNDGDDAKGLTLGKSNSIVEGLGAENDEELEEELDEESEADERYMIIFGHHNSAMELEISAKWGCYICQTFWDKVEPHLQQELDHRVPSSYRINGPVFFTYAYLTQDENRDGIKLRIHTLVMSRYPSTFFLRPNYDVAQPPYNDGDGDGDGDGPRPHRISDRFLEKSLHTVKAWLQMCDFNHGTCNVEKAQVPFYPTRLLELSGVRNTTEFVRLVETAQETMNGVYTTLSHRWGAADFLQLKRKNLGAFCDAIAIKDLPRTFQDAIDVSRKLGINYLWIDSLCIMQDKDDLNDWFREAGLMHKVYSHSYCNLSATGAVDSSHGLYQPRYAHDNHDTKVNLYVRHHNGHIQRSIRTIQASHYELWDQYVTQAAINQRGWVFQERALSPRVLHFGRHQLFWECRESQRYEKCPMNDLEAMDPLEDGVYHIKSYWENAFARGKYNAKPQEYWRAIIEPYSATCFTNAGDKLIALSGIAKKVASITGDTYVAGFWRKHLEEQLLWRLQSGDSREELLPRSSHYCAPSWSWASIKGRIAYDFWVGVPMSMRVEDVQLTYATKDSTGRITSGWLDLKGNLRAFRMWRSSHRFGDFDNSEVLIGDYHKPFPMKRWPDALESQLLDFKRDNDQGSLFCLQATPDDRLDATFLLLQSDPTRKGWFRRVGLGKMMIMDPASSGISAELSKALDMKTDPNLPSLHYDGRLHTIRIF